MGINPEDLIINLPDQQTKQQRALAVAIVIMFWAAFLYLLRPLLIVVGWAVGYYILKSTTFDLEAEGVFRMVFLTYLPLVVGCSLILWLWAIYNRLRFGGDRDKRRHAKQEATNMEAISYYFRVPVDALKTIHASRRLTFHFDRAGRFCRLRCARPEPDGQSAPPAPPTRTPRSQSSRRAA